MIIPGILETSFEEIQKKYNLFKDTAELIQIDLADGEFVDNTTYLDFEEFEKLEGTAKLEIHAMTNVLYPFIEKKITTVEKICVHCESKDFSIEILGQLWMLGYEIGVSLNPETNLHSLEECIDKVDYVQFMTVKPGKQGNPFESSVLQKIKEFKNKYPDIETQVDGGINNETINKVLSLNVDNVVIGSGIFESKDPLAAFKNFKKTAYGNTN